MTKWNIIWQVDPNDLSMCLEREWFYELTSLVPVNSITIDYDKKSLLRVALPHSIICASCPNQTNVQDLSRYLQRIPKPRVLYHMSDEFVQMGRDLYQHCDLVLRNGSALFDHVNDPRIIQMPLGYVSRLKNGAGAFPRSSERKCSFAFLGTIKNDRAEMLHAFDDMPGRKLVRKTISFAGALKYHGTLTTVIYKQSVFVPNPKGNWSPECFRLYDALEWGCIPLIKRYRDSMYHVFYHDGLLGSHPIPTFNTWREAVNFAKDLLCDMAALDDLQSRIGAWWRKYKSDLQIVIADKLARLAA